MTTGLLPDSAGYLLSLMAVIVVRHALGGPLLFPGEIIGEDLILLLILTFWLVPAKFKAAIWRVMGFAISTTMALVTWTIPTREPLLAKVIFYRTVFALLASYSAVLALRELSKLGKEGLNGVPPDGSTQRDPE